MKTISIEKLAEKNLEMLSPRKRLDEAVRTIVMRCLRLGIEISIPEDAESKILKYKAVGRRMVDTPSESTLKRRRYPRRRERICFASKTGNRILI